GRTFPIIQGIPIMLVDGIDQTIRVAEKTLNAARQKADSDSEDHWCLDATVINDCKLPEVKRLLANGTYRFSIDPVISYLICKRNGHLYEQLVGDLKDYPIPDIPLARTSNVARRWMLDVGCSWGRWSLSAATKGYNVVGLDPSLGAVLAGRRAA